MTEFHPSNDRIGGTLNHLGLKNSTALRVDNVIFVGRVTGVDLQIGQPLTGGIAGQVRQGSCCIRSASRILG
jgi:hypothetical protein